jgi:hypothetical protein
MMVSLGRLLFCLSVSDKFSLLLVSSLSEIHNREPCGPAVSRLQYLDTDLSMSFSLVIILYVFFFSQNLLMKLHLIVFFYNEYALHLSSSNVLAFNIDDDDYLYLPHSN